MIPRAGGSLTQARTIDPIDVVLPILHGPFGEDGTVQGMLEMVGLPYVGSGVTGSAVTMDKDLVKPLLASVGIATAPSVTFRAHVAVDHEAELATAGIAPPCFVKPARLGSSVGISKVNAIDELAPALELAFRHDSKVLVEQMVEGREVECGVLGNSEPIVSLPGEITIQADWYDFDAKYKPGGMELIVPADLPPEADRRDPAGRADRLCPLRVRRHGPDRLLRDARRCGRPERDQHDPGIHRHQRVRHPVRGLGHSLPELLDRLIELALERHREARQYAY